MRTILLAALLLSFFVSIGQTTIKGKVTDSKGEPLTGANVFVKGSYDGTAATDDGSFSFKTSLTGNQTLVATFIGFALQEKEVEITGKGVEVVFKLKDESNRLGDVVITAGTYETADRKRSVTLQPLDIVTTPSATGDIYGALTALPGTATVGEDGRLFVRGGDGYETKTFIDGLLSKKPYSSNVPDLPSRGRFSPFLFTGTTFSTGGYSAEYGQALSSALILNTNSFPQQTQTDVSIMTVGGGVSQTVKGDKTAASFGVDYTNLTPYFQLVPSKFSMNQYPESVGTTFTFRQKVSESGILKAFSTFSGTRFGLEYPDLSIPGSMANIAIANKNSYTNISYSDDLGNGWILKSGVAFTYDKNKLDMESFNIDEGNNNAQAKLVLKKNFTNNVSLIFGAEETYNHYNQDYFVDTTLFHNNSIFNDFGSAAFAETEFRPLDFLAVRAGVRSEYSTLLNDYNIAARFSAAVKLTKSAQVSIAYGNFYQTPEETLLRFTHSLNFEQANHYIVNYQWERSDRILRVEGYRKDYKDLVTYNSTEFWNGDLYSNSGSGYSQGVDVFFRDRRTFKSFEYWFSYSYVDSKRKYRDYPEMVTPHFAPEHTASFVGKKWVQSITTQFGMSVTFASGRPYNNPNSDKFMDGKTPYYNDISLNCSHLTTIFKKPTIIYMSVNNLLGRDNIFGYRYYSKPNEEGIYEAFPVKSESKRFYFVGIFITL
ncbi:MAG TPA: TonB-dependent receptor [Tenuifilaceae bacterium]|nr:TonB-dependent receptor [Tenuifilaceae bacterium]HPJ46280.1 TonB-dependent receptor [Tenuifilaceae bacterium]HPQ34654.1 TonB-dependent receptor [Tenuifilaceae bacterium]